MPAGLRASCGPHATPHRMAGAVRSGRGQKKSGRSNPERVVDVRNPFRTQLHGVKKPDPPHAAWESLGENASRHSTGIPVDGGVDKLSEPEWAITTPVRIAPATGVKTRARASRSYHRPVTARPLSLRGARSAQWQSGWIASSLRSYRRHLSGVVSQPPKSPRVGRALAMTI